MKIQKRFAVLPVTFAVVTAMACFVNDPQGTSCAPPDEADMTCVPCTGGHCPPALPINNKVSASIDAYRGSKLAVWDDPDSAGLDTYQSTLSDCEIKVTYVCDGDSHTVWIDTSGCNPPHYDNVPAGAACTVDG